MTAEVLLSAFVGVAASIQDLLRREISNWIPTLAFFGGLACQCAMHGWYGIPAALAGSLCGLLVFLVFYWLGGMGGGDVKLMAGFGAVLGAGRLLEAALWTGAVGGLIAAGVIAYGAIRNRVRPAPASAKAPESIPYAPAIALGVWLALVPK